MSYVNLSIVALGTNLEEITIRDIYKIDENSKEIATVNYGVWTPNKGLRIVEPNVWIRRSNFKGHQLRYFSSIYQNKFFMAKLYKVVHLEKYLKFS